MPPADVWTRFETLRWGSGPERCPHCGERGPCVRLPRSAASRPARRVWRCTACRQQFSVLTGTVLARSRVPLDIWLEVTRTLVDGTPVSARELARRHGITPATARQLVARLRAAGVPSSSPDAEDALRRVLRLPPDAVARVVATTPSRRGRPEPGPSADYR